MMGAVRLYEKPVCPVGNQMERACPLKTFRKNWRYSSRFVFTGKIRKLLNHLLLLFPSFSMKFEAATGGKWNGTVLCTGRIFRERKLFFFQGANSSFCLLILQFQLVKNSHRLFPRIWIFDRSIKLGFRLRPCSRTRWTVLGTFKTPLRPHQTD